MPSSFQLLPAIDLVDRRIVRLEQGDFDRQTIFGDDPTAVAGEFATAGAGWLHVVDLDGARAGEPRQLATCRAIVEAVGDRARVEIAGGLRTMAAIEAAFETGADRVVLGTAALQEPTFAARAVEAYGGGIVAAIDVRSGRAVGEGWRPGAPDRPVGEAIGALAAAGVKTFEVTAIERDGLRTGPDLDLLRSVLGPGRAIIASGGIGTIADVIALREAGCAGAIVGRALYEGDLTIGALVEALERTPPPLGG